MKKTIAMLFCLSVIAAAKTVSPLDSANSDNWTFSNNDISIADGVLKNTGHWNSGWADYKFDTAITLNSNMTLELNYIMTFYEASDVAATVAMHSTSDVLAFGVKTYNGGSNDAPFCIGYSTDSVAISANAVTFNQGYGYIFTLFTETDNTAGIIKTDADDITSVSRAIKETITWSEEDQKYVATLYVDGAVAGTQTLGDSYTLEKLSFTTAGNGNMWSSQPSYSNIQISVIPEPTTATLSLLALAGLAARRRRK